VCASYYGEPGLDIVDGVCFNRRIGSQYDYVFDEFRGARFQLIESN
jgi:hypothetical protein